MLDVQSLIAGLTLSAEDKTAIQDLFSRNPDAVTALQTRATEYITTEVGAARTELDTKRQELEAEWTALRSYRGTDEQVLADLQTKYERAQAKLAVAESRIEATAKAHGLDADALLKDIREAPLTAKVIPTGGRVESTMDEAALLAKAGSLAWKGVEMTATLYDIDREHQRLFGKPIESASAFLKDMAEEARRTNNANLSPTEFADKKYGFATKRAEVAEAAIVARETAAAAKALETYKSEQALRVTTTGNPNPEHVPSPIFGSLKPEQQSPVQVNGVPDAVAASILHFRKITAAA